MAVAGSTDVAIELFGGLVTDMAPADLPAGVSPDCQDVKFVSGSVQTRPGLQSIFGAIAGTPKVNYLKTYVTPTGLLRLLALDAAGSLWKESSVGVLSLISSTNVVGSLGKSTSLFLREYLALSDGKTGIDIPRQFDDVNYDRVSQVGPGQAPSAADESNALAIIASPSGTSQSIINGTINASPNGLSEVGNVVTVSMSFSSNLDILQPGDQVIIAGAGVGGYNGTFTVLTSVTVNNTFTYYNPTSGLAASGNGTVATQMALVNLTAAAFVPAGSSVLIAGVGVAGYNGTWLTRKHAGDPASSTSFFAVLNVGGLANSGNGTVTVNGNISAGIHKISVVFKTRQGYLTAPAPPLFWTAAGSKRVVVTNIPTGPSNVVARILLFTLAGQSFFFYSSGIIGIAGSNFIISDNTTTSVTVDFTDIGLASQISADYLFKLVELGECAGVIEYNSRLFWWGERNKVGNFLNLTFDGGHYAITGGGNAPLGWAADSANFHNAGGFSTNPAVWGEAYQIVGDGATATMGMITQPAYQDANGVPIIQANVAYSVRVKLARQGAVTQGNLVIDLSSASVGTLGTFSVAISGVPSGGLFQEFIGSLMASRTSIPSDTLIRVYTSGTFSAATVIIDNIEIFPTNQPNNNSLIRASRVEDPESYDGVTGFLNISENDGYAVRSAFVIRENLYFVKEHGLYVTQDDGTNEPSQWKVTDVSRKVGTPSVNGVAAAQDWAVIADRTGLYYTNGGEPKKISQEIQPTWDRINWAAGQTLWVQIDLQNKRIYVGAPLDGATSPNKILMLDYRGIDPPEDIATSGAIHTSYAGKILVLEKSRKWSPWTITANSGAIVERFDGTQQMFLGNGAGNGKIYQLSDSQLGTDDGVAIPSYYQTYFHFSHDIEQGLNLGSHNKLFYYLSQFVEGNGQLVVSAVPPGAAAITVASITLSNPGLRDTELPINVTAVRAAFKVSTNQLGEWWKLTRLITNAMKHPSAPVRGWN